MSVTDGITDLLGKRILRENQNVERLSQDQGYAASIRSFKCWNDNDRILLQVIWIFVKIANSSLDSVFRGFQYE